MLAVVLLFRVTAKLIVVEEVMGVVVTAVMMVWFRFDKDSRRAG